MFFSATAAVATVAITTGGIGSGGTATATSSTIDSIAAAAASLFFFLGRHFIFFSSIFPNSRYFLSLKFFLLFHTHLSFISFAIVINTRRIKFWYSIHREIHLHARENIYNK